MLAFLTSGLGLGRLVGLVLDASGSGSTGGALAFEFVSAAVAIWLLRSQPEPATA